MPHRDWTPTKPTPIEELRKPHPEQKRIDTESAAILRATALDVFRRIGASAPATQAAGAASRILG